jgi:hypothetical protein
MAEAQRALDALTAHAAAALGPIAALIVEQAAADGASLALVRERVAAEIDLSARERFLAATAPLVAAHKPPAQPPAAPERAGAPSIPGHPQSNTLDHSDPRLIADLAEELRRRLGAEGHALVEEAARRCRTRIQLFLRLAAAVQDPQLKRELAARAVPG